MNHLSALGVDERMINVHYDGDNDDDDDVSPMDVGSPNAAPTDVAAVDVAPKERHS